MVWNVYFKKSSKKQFDDLPKNIKENVLVLVHEIEKLGPLRYNWKNFNKFKGMENRYH